jgi:hypothetical protein
MRLITHGASIEDLKAQITPQAPIAANGVASGVCVGGGLAGGAPIGKGVRVQSGMTCTGKEPAVSSSSAEPSGPE